MKQQFLEDIADTIRLTVYQDNRPVTPTSATITLYTSSGSVLQASASATVSATTGEMTYSLTATHTATRDLNYKAVWAYVVNGTTYYETQLFDVVRSILAISITDDDLYAELESLRKVHMQASGTATAGAVGSITDTARRKEEDNYWKGGTVEIISGTGANQSRIVTGNTQSTGLISVTPDWTTTPDSTSVYRVVKSFTSKIEQSFKKLSTLIYDKGKRHQLILESSQLEVPLLYLTIHHICLDLMNEADDRWDRLAKTYEEKFKNSFGNLTLEYDEDDTGTVQGTEEAQTGIGGIRIFRG